MESVMKHLIASESKSVAAQKAIQGRAFKSLRAHGVKVDESAVNKTFNHVSQKDREEKLEIGAKKELSVKGKMDKLTRKRNRAMVNGADKEAGIKTAELGKKWAAKENIIKKQAKSQRAKYMERLAKYQAKMEKKKKKAAEKKHKAAEKKHKLHSKELLDKSKVKKELRMKRAK